MTLAWLMFIGCFTPIRGITDSDFALTLVLNYFIQGWLFTCRQPVWQCCSKKILNIVLWQTIVPTDSALISRNIRRHAESQSSSSVFVALDCNSWTRRCQGVFSSWGQGAYCFLVNIESIVDPFREKKQRHEIRWRSRSHIVRVNGLSGSVMSYTK